MKNQRTPNIDPNAEMDAASRAFNDFIKPLGVDMEKVTRLSNSDDSVTSSEGFSIGEDARIHAREAVSILKFFSNRVNHRIHKGDYLLERLRDIFSSEIELSSVKRRAENLIGHLEWLFEQKVDVWGDQTNSDILSVLRNY